MELTRYLQPLARWWRLLVATAAALAALVVTLLLPKTCEATATRSLSSGPILTT